MVSKAKWTAALRSAKLPVSITIPAPSIFSPAATFLCSHMVAEICRPAALALCHNRTQRWPTAQKNPHSVHKIKALEGAPSNTEQCVCMCVYVSVGSESNLTGRQMNTVSVSCQHLGNLIMIQTS